MLDPIRVLIRHADQLIAAGAAAALAAQPDLLVVDEPPDADVLIADYDGALAWLASSRSPWIRVLVLSWRDGEAEIRHALQRGARGYVLGHCRLDELTAAVRSVGNGRPHVCPGAAKRLAQSLMRAPLTPRETEVLRLMAQGLPNKRIASRLAIALGTVKAHNQAILAKLEARSRTEASAIAEERGLLGPRLELVAREMTMTALHHAASEHAARHWAHAAHARHPHPPAAAAA
jgi:DNA-binding NarL/FixJ family response regulator